MAQRTVPPEYILRVAPVLETLHDRLKKIGIAQPDWYAPASKAADDAQRSRDSEAIKTLVSQCVFFVEHGADHLAALPRLLTGDSIIVMPIWTTTRAILESSAWACWLLQPSITRRTRLTRTTAIRNLGQNEIDRVGRLFEKDELTSFAAVRRDVIAAQAKQRGIPSRNAPKISDVIRDVFGTDARNYYSLLSAVAHANPTLMLSLLYDTDRETKIARKAANTNLLALLLVNSTEWFVRAAWDLAVYIGADLRDYAEAFNEAFRGLHLRGHQHFWRQDGALLAWYGKPRRLIT